MCTSYPTLKNVFRLISNYFSSGGESIMFSLRSACQDVSPEFHFLCTHPNSKQHTYTYFSLANVCSMLTLAHYLSISSSQACLTVAGVVQLSKWCKNRLKIEGNFIFLTGLYQFFPFSDLECILWEQLLRRGTQCLFPGFFRCYGKLISYSICRVLGWILMCVGIPTECDIIFFGWYIPVEGNTVKCSRLQHLPRSVRRNRKRFNCCHMWR